MRSKYLNDPVVTRLSALWALAEITLGGVLHTLRIPLTGLFVGSTALACVYLIARSTNSALTILKALLAVMAIKVMSLPHASPFSYLAMSFQAACCMPLIGRRGNSRAWVTSLFIVASMYSPLQKLVILYITFGHEGLYVVLDALRNWLSPQLTTGEFLFLPLVLWFGAHIVAGYLLSVWLLRWVSYDSVKDVYHDEWIRSRVSATPELQDQPIMTVRRIILSLIILVALSGLYFYESELPAWMHVLWRPLLIILSWQVVVRPLIQRFSRRLISGSANSKDVKAVMDELPQMWSILTFAQTKSAEVTGWVSRIKTFLKVTIALTTTRMPEVKHD